ncbi:MAG TPA: HPr family phosphocarrier protein [Rhodospirillales bacterium]|nr:HPr family phosphocarrier protein [Rhodospirillales bacterium]
MPKAYLKIDNQQWLHARAAAKFVKIASNYDIEVTVSKDG